MFDPRQIPAALALVGGCMALMYVIIFLIDRLA